jgi:hypothetical protein
MKNQPPMLVIPDRTAPETAERLSDQRATTP